MNQFSSVQFSLVAQSCPTLCNPMNCSTPGLPVHHQLPELTQTHVHRVSDAIQPSHPLSSPPPPAPNPSQHQSLFQWVNSSPEVAKGLEFQLQHHSLQRNPRAHLLQNGLVGSPCNPRDSQEFSPTSQFKTSVLRHSAFFTEQWIAVMRAVSDHKVKVFSLSPLKIMLAVGFSRGPFIMLRKCPSIPSMLCVVVMKYCWHFSNYFWHVL